MAGDSGGFISQGVTPQYCVCGCAVVRLCVCVCVCV